MKELKPSFTVTVPPMWCTRCFKPVSGICRSRTRKACSMPRGRTSRITPSKWEDVINEVKLEVVLSDDARAADAARIIQDNAQTGQELAGRIYVSEPSAALPILSAMSADSEPLMRAACDRRNTCGIHGGSRFLCSLLGVIGGDLRGENLLHNHRDAGLRDRNHESHHIPDKGTPCTHSFHSSPDYKANYCSSHGYAVHRNPWHNQQEKRQV